MSGEQNERADMPILTAVGGANTRGRPASIEERRRLVAESLQVGNPLNRSKELPEQADPIHDCQIELKVDQIRPYEHNPRRANNEKFFEIKESIRSAGIRNPLTVTRRPGEQHFIVEAGGNTRLLAIQELWAETRDPRFEKLTVLFRPWRSEGHVLVAHLIENEQRGDLTFWDKANGVIALKARLEEEKGRPLSLRQFEEELKAAGFLVNKATLVHYLYATARLAVIGEGIPVLTGLDVRTIQPRLNLLKRYAEARRRTEEQVLYEAVFEPVFRLYVDRYRESEEFDASQLCQDCEEALAQYLQEDLVRFRMVLDALAKAPQIERDALQQIVESFWPKANGLAAPAAPEDGSGVYSVNTPVPACVPQAGPRASARPPESIQIDHGVLDQLKACISRFSGLGAQPFETQAWSLLAPVWARLHERVRQLLPEAPGREDGIRLTLMTLDAEFFDWLLDGRNEAATTFWEIATLIRNLRGAAPESQADSGRLRPAGSR